ncbi:MAG: hypothetical protein H8D43_03295 [Chloroflexi bacterium]|nr:hypothetical protein [Chloroflexota bacterium]
MGKLVAFVIFLIGMMLLTVGLAVPPVLLQQSFGSVLWKVLLGLLLAAVSYVMADYVSSRFLQKLMAILIAFFGLGLAGLALIPAVLGFSLYGTAGTAVRVILGLLLCLGGWVISEYEPDY